MNRNSARNFSLYMGIFLIIAMLYNVMQEMDRAEGPDYSQIRTYFMQEQVERNPVTGHLCSFVCTPDGQTRKALALLFWTRWMEKKPELSPLPLR